ncbi:hypothetical protein IL306_014656 [Fusarium sp. DS 682]|nr:hypothetical protein IL306_014656 [Fusarium sp. DS 682]
MHSPHPQETQQAHEDGLWRRVLLSSPWFDCPIFEDLLRKPQIVNGKVRRKNGEVVMKRRDPHFEELEEEFLERWWFKASKLKLRRFDNGDAVLPITARSYRDMYGEEAMKWKIEEEVAETDEAAEGGNVEDEHEEESDDEESSEEESSEEESSEEESFEEESSEEDSSE